MGQVLHVMETNATLHGGTYTCVVLNDAGFGLNVGVLHVTPIFHEVPQDIETVSGSNVQFSCQAESFPYPAYRWERSLNGGDFETIDVANENILTFNPVNYSDAGIYRCVAVSNNETHNVSMLVSPTAILYGKLSR